MTKWLPHQHRILVKVKKVEDKIGSIFIPEETRTKEQQAQVLAEVVAVGPTAEVDRDLIKKGTVVMISKWGGAEIPDGGEVMYRVINDEDINAVMGGDV